MARESLGIILQGYPDLKQKQTVPLRLLTAVLRNLWWVCAIAAVVVFLFSIRQDSVFLLYTALCLVLWAAVFLVVSLLWGPMGRCPFCGHFGTLKRISSDKLVWQQDKPVRNRVDTYHSGVGYDSRGNTAFFNGKSTHWEQGTESSKEYTFNTRCTCCQSVVKIKRYSFERK